MNEETLRRTLTGDLPALRIHYFAETISTNRLAKAAGVVDVSFEMFVADRQTGGYGRLGRTWDSPSGNLAFTLLWREHGISQREAPKLSLVTAVAVTKALQKIAFEGLSIKWPNDVLIDGRKLAGILIEQAAGGAFAIGIGINVNSTLNDFSPETRGERMTLREKLGRQLPREEIFSEVTRLLVQKLEQFQKGDWPNILDQCRSLSFLTGREIEVREGTRWIAGKGEGIDDDGLLLVSTSDGLRQIASGDVRVRT